MHIEIQNCFNFVPQTPYQGFAPGPHRGISVPQTPCTGRPPHFVPGLHPWLYQDAVAPALGVSKPLETHVFSPVYNAKFGQVESYERKRRREIRQNKNVTTAYRIVAQGHRAFDSMFYRSTICALQIILWLWLYETDTYRSPTYDFHRREEPFFRRISVLLRPYHIERPNSARQKCGERVLGGQPLAL